MVKKSIQEQVNYMKNYIGRKRLKGMLDKLTQEKNSEIKVLGEGAYSVVFGYKDVAIKFYKDKANMSKLYTINNHIILLHIFFCVPLIEKYKTTSSPILTCSPFPSS